MASVRQLFDAAIVPDFLKYVKRVEDAIFDVWVAKDKDHRYVRRLMYSCFKWMLEDLSAMHDGMTFDSRLAEKSRGGLIREIDCSAKQILDVSIPAGLQTLEAPEKYTSFTTHPEDCNRMRSVDEELIVKVVDNDLYTGRDITSMWYKGHLGGEPRLADACIWADCLSCLVDMHRGEVLGLCTYNEISKTYDECLGESSKRAECQLEWKASIGKRLQAYWLVDRESLLLLDEQGDKYLVRNQKLTCIPKNIKIEGLRLVYTAN